MEKFSIILAPKAEKDLDQFNEKQCKGVLKHIKLLEENPFPRGKLIKKLKGTRKSYYRLRIDRYRVFFRIEANKIVVLWIFSKKNAEKIIKGFK